MVYVAAPSVNADLAGVKPWQPDERASWYVGRAIVGASEAQLVKEGRSIHPKAGRKPFGRPAYTGEGTPSCSRRRVLESNVRARLAG